MGKRAEVGTPKHLANAMKAKGLQRLRWYCQVCQKQCRDENGFKCHTQSEGHLRQMLVVGENGGKHIADYSQQFQGEFVALLSRTCGTQRVKANNIYQDFIRDRNHLHMNATRWVSLTGFIQHLGQAGIVRVEDTEKGLFISWIDNSPKALAKAEANMKKERLNKSDEQRERQLISEQIERAAAEAESYEDDSGSSTPPPTELKLNEGEKVKFSLSLKKPVDREKAKETSSTTPPSNSASPPDTKADAEDKSSTTVSLTLNKPSIATTTATSTAIAAPAPINVFKTNAFKIAAKPAPTNVFKSASNPLKALAASGSALGTSSVVGVKRPTSMTEALMQEDVERKRRRMEKDPLRA